MTRKTKTNWLDRTLVLGPFLALFTTEKAYKAEMKLLGVENPNPWILEGSNATVHNMQRGGDVMCVVCMPVNKDFSPADVTAVLVHEAVHVWQAFASHIGERKPSDEFEAYAIQNISQTLIDEYQRQRKAQKCKTKKKRSTRS